MNRKIGIIFALALCCPLIVNADSTNENSNKHNVRASLGEMDHQNHFRELVDNAAEVYSSVTNGSQGKLPASVLKGARCIAVLPDVVTGAFILGGTHGLGLASCVDEKNVWSQPVPISLKQGSIGLQAGAKSTDLVLFFQSKDAVSALKAGNFALGTDISAVAGSYASNVDTSTSGVVVYSRTEGVFAGVSISGSQIGKDESDIQKYYGKSANYRAILEGRESPDTSGHTKKLTTLFPQYSNM